MEYQKILIQYKSYQEKGNSGGENRGTNRKQSKVELNSTISKNILHVNNSNTN